MMTPRRAIAIPIFLSFFLLGVVEGRSQEAEADAELESLDPTWETQTEARTMLLRIPAPRGQIADRQGRPLARNRVAHYLALQFTDLGEVDKEVILATAREKIAWASQTLAVDWSLSDEAIVRHYRNRRWLPLPFSPLLTEEQVELLGEQLPEGLTLHPIYIRSYPHASLAGHILGYIGTVRPLPTGPIANGQPLWEETEGRAGLEKIYDRELRGQDGEVNMLFDEEGRKVSQEMVRRPVPGDNVITSLDLDFQQLAEKILSEKAQRGALVVVEVESGDILAMASWPVFDPNLFVPSISQEQYRELTENPDLPLFGRALRGVYPPGSTFKLAVGLAALQKRVVDRELTYPCTALFSFGDRVYRNWKEEDSGELNIVEAITESCNTWFYRAGLQTGADPILRAAQKLGYGAPTGVPLEGEPQGVVPTKEFMEKTPAKRLYPGDVVNLSIGQGRLLVTPLQTVQAMAAIAQGRSLPKLRLVQQVQNLNNEVLQHFPMERRNFLNFSAADIRTIKKGMHGVVQAGKGTAKSAWNSVVDVAGKTGTSQWGAVEEEKNVAWFAGFVPARRPQYAFVALYEGSPGEKVSGGAKAAPMVGEFFRTIYDQPERYQVRLPEGKEPEVQEEEQGEIAAAPASDGGGSDLEGGDADPELVGPEKPEEVSGAKEDSVPTAPRVARAIWVPDEYDLAYEEVFSPEGEWLASGDGEEEEVIVEKEEEPKKKGFFRRLFGGE